MQVIFRTSQVQLLKQLTLKLGSHSNLKEVMLDMKEFLKKKYILPEIKVDIVENGLRISEPGFVLVVR